jgi:hypothetical protein
MRGFNLLDSCKKNPSVYGKIELFVFIPYGPVMSLTLSNVHACDVNKVKQANSNKRKGKVSRKLSEFAFA